MTKKESKEKKQEKIGDYSAKNEEPKIFDFWKTNKIYEKLVERNNKNKTFYYLDGPPYTSGRIHIGHAWGKALRDSILRYKRMQGFNVKDQPGFDMHGLPIENQVEKDLGINKQEIIEKFGIGKFIEECKSFAKKQMTPMIKDFERSGIWMDWKNPYMTLKNGYIEGVWHALKLAEQNGYLYEGKKAMTWCPDCATALAKHELEYEERTDDSIFVKFKILGRENEFLIIWTTTPWTIPFNLGVMVHPDFDYIRAKIKDTGETWIVAKSLGSVISATAEKHFEVIEELKGAQLEGIRYIHPFLDELNEQKHIFENNPRAHSVLLSKEYVSLDAGSGLVHCAPGCGPEDFEVGKKYGLPAYNEIGEYGRFPKSTGILEGMRAKKDDAKFTDLLDKKGILVAKTKITHDYAHCWRSKTPVVYKATDQWFLAVEKIKDEMINENKKISWVPDWAGSRWFNSWLESLQDWCISRQRFWGIPLPIWRCECGDITVVGSKKELEEISGKKIGDLHRPYIDEVKIKCKSCGNKEVSRVEDILDVWLDSGAAPWAALNYPSSKEYEQIGIPDLILEGKDQIRGWFNSLTCMSMLSFKTMPFKAVYMHGFVNDAQGRKFSKSLKNGVSPYEVIDEYGADVMRYYLIGGANPGLDMNYNFDDTKLKSRNLSILWNIHKFLVDSAKNLKKNPAKLKIDEKNFALEEKYILSKLNSTIKLITHKFDTYKLNEIPQMVEDLFLKLSRTYMQNTRDKSALGSDEEKEVVLYTIYNVLYDVLKLFAPIVPFITEKIYHNLKNEFKLKEESIHLVKWPKFNESGIDETLEKNVENSEKVVAGILHAREKSQIGVRWPIKSAIIETKSEEIKSAVHTLSEIIKNQTNLREIKTVEKFEESKLSVKPDYAKLNPVFKQKTPQIIAKMVFESTESLINHINEKGKFVLNLDGEKVDIKKEHLLIERKLPDNYSFIEFSDGVIYLDIERTNELDAEGYARELMRRIQVLRKNQGLRRNDKVELALVVPKELLKDIEKHKDLICERCGVKKFSIKDEKPKGEFSQSTEEKIKGKEFGLHLKQVK